jgi:hypothetical protein
MYRFDDKTRRQLLEDALVADLLDPASSEARGATGPVSAESTPVAPVAAPGATGRPKRSA